jgi:hypothetical protein
MVFIALSYIHRAHSCNLSMLVDVINISVQHISITDLGRPQAEYLFSDSFRLRIAEDKSFRMLESNSLQARLNHCFVGFISRLLMGILEKFQEFESEITDPSVFQDIR